MRAPNDSYVHQHARSTSLYYIRDVPADIRAEVGRAKWKQSLGTAQRAEALKKARQLAEEHDRTIENLRARRRSPLDSLREEDREKILADGGIEPYLLWMNDRACEAQSLRSDAEFWTEFAADEGPPEEIPDPDWARAKVSGLKAEEKAIESHIAREAPLIRTLTKHTAHFVDSSLGYRPPAPEAVQWPAAQPGPATPATPAIAPRPIMN
ncbi:MAG: integrase catalytic subunit [Hyphomicrobiales bacterium]|nr:integrase catalytic subunit [Hyphomicrobiales bacterium]